MSHSLPNKLADLADRLERANDCAASVGDLFLRYRNACAQNAWSEADELRVLLMEAVEAQLDTIAAVFKTFGGPYGQGA